MASLILASGLDVDAETRRLLQKAADYGRRYRSYLSEDFWQPADLTDKLLTAGQLSLQTPGTHRQSRPT